MSTTFLSEYYIIQIYVRQYIFSHYNIFMSIINKHEDDKFVVEKIHIFEFISRRIRHIPDEQFKTIRYYGFYSSHKHKLYNTCRRIIPSIKLPLFKSLNKWRMLILRTFKYDPLICSNCNTVMIYETGYV